MPSMNRARFLAQYVYEVEQDWAVHDVPATWASPSAHRFWDEEDASITVPLVPDDGDQGRTKAAISLDNVLIALTSGNVITTFDLATKTKIADFSGPLEPCQKLIFSARGSRTDADVGGRSGYLLVSQSSEISCHGSEMITFWALDSQGRPVSADDGAGDRYLDVEGLASHSLDAIKSTILSEHRVEKTSPMFDDVLKGYRNALRTLDSKLRLRDRTGVTGRFTSYSLTPLSTDGRLMVYTICNRTTQHGMRPPEDLPQIILYDVEAAAMKHVLPGHTDTIIWAELSPDARLVASACWDQSFRIWDVATGSCKHVIGPTGGQNCSGTWCPDSKHVLLSGMHGNSKGPTVAVYNAETGTQHAVFEQEGMNRWVRQLAWCPSDANLIAIGAGVDVWLWKPFDDPPAVINHFRLKADGLLKSFAGTAAMRWVDEGKKLAVMTGDKTVEVFDLKNKKYRYQRPFGLPAASGSDILWTNDGQLVIPCGDGKIRFWRL